MPISDGSEAVAARHRRELAEFLASFTRYSPRLRGLSPTVPATGSLRNDSYRSSGSVERSIYTHTATPEAAGTVPATGSLRNDSY
ncbi:MAG UNVERIFIED_CONTAM: hypothetical protein LVR18_11305 [Planctomycetaceae bacterium]